MRGLALLARPVRAILWPLRWLQAVRPSLAPLSRPRSLLEPRSFGERDWQPDLDALHEASHLAEPTNVIPLNRRLR